MALSTAFLADALPAAAEDIAVAEGHSPAESLARMRPAEGFAASLFASEPLVRQPVAMNFDSRGRLWVIQYLQYPTPAGLEAVAVDQYLRTKYDKVPDPPPHGPQGADRITILEDTDGDGRADKAKDFVAGLNLATGLAIGHGGVFVVQAPYLLFYPDRDGDDVPDGNPEVLLTGFGLEDAHALANSLQWGPDGWLYGAQGSTVTASIRGVTFQQGVWRYHPRTREFELFAEGGGNTWGLDFDRHGQVIAGTNYGGAANLHQVQGAYYVKGFAKHGELQNPYAFGYFEHVPYEGFRGGHVTCGGVVYRGGAFPEVLDNQYLAANVLSNAIHWHGMTPNRSTFRARHGGELLTTDESWFRPVDCAVGPDGALWIADWCDKRANHVDPVDDWDRTNGRIYRLAAANAPEQPPFDLRSLASDELVDLLAHRNAWFRREARSLLADRRDASVVARLCQQALDATDQEQALESLWGLYVSGGWDDAAAGELLGSPHEYVRAWAVRLLGDPRTVSAPLSKRLVELAASDPSAVVRSQLACTAKRLPGGDGLPIARALAERDEDRDDPFLPLLIWWAIEDKAASDREAILTLFADAEFWRRPIVEQILVERIARRYAAAAEADDFASCGRLLALAPTDADRVRVVRGMDLGLAGRMLDSTPAPLAAPLASLWSAQEAPSPELLRVAVRLGIQPARDRVLATLAADEASAEALRASIALAAEMADTRAVESLLALAFDDGPAATRSAALAAVGRFDDERVGARLMAALATLPDDLRATAQNLLCSRAAWARSLLSAVDAGQIPPEAITSEQLRRIALHKNRELAAIVEKHWGAVAEQTPADRQARVHGIRVSLQLAPGDASRGRELFTKHCGVCHRLFGEGNQVGPELTGADRKDLDFLLNSVVDPSSVIRKEFFNYVLETTDGRVFTGLVAESTPTTVTILDEKNQRIVIPQSEVEQLERAAKSLMPERILDQLDAQQVRDLVRYLQSDPPTAAAGAE